MLGVLSVPGELGVADSDFISVLRKDGELVREILLFDFSLDGILGELIGRYRLEDEPALDEAVYSCEFLRSGGDTKGISRNDGRQGLTGSAGLTGSRPELEPGRVPTEPARSRMENCRLRRPPRNRREGPRRA